jgi:hypothetical protein
MKRNLFVDGYDYEGCKLFVVPPLPGSLALIKAYKVSPAGSRGDYSPGRNKLHRFGKGLMC